MRSEEVTSDSAGCTLAGTFTEVAAPVAAALLITGSKRGIGVHARWIRDFVGYDPSAALARVTVPVLAITGGQDFRYRPKTSPPSADWSAAPLTATSSATSAICSAPIPGR